MEPAGRALVEERAQPFLPLGAATQAGRYARKLLAGARVLAHQPLGGAGRLRPGLQKLRDDVFDRSVKVLRDLVHEPDPQRGRGVEALAGEEVASRLRTDLAEHERR